MELRKIDTAHQSLEVISSRNMSEWMMQHHVSLAITTYQAGKLLLVGVKSDGRLSVFERTFDRCMGLWSNGQTIWMSSRFQLWRIENMLDPDSTQGEFDRLYAPQLGYTTGDIDIHDICVDGDERPVFVCTLFNCISTIDERYSFRPIWRPNFISKLAAEDRCHLNGMTIMDGIPAYVTACSCSDVVDGWRDRRESGGVLIDVRSNEVISDGFSMPHSPRCYRDQLYLLDSGNGFFGLVDIQSGKFEPITFCPGYARGLSFVGKYALIGLSRPRHSEQSFQGLPLDNQLQRHDTGPRCGVLVVDLDSGNVVHWIRIDGGVIDELYDVVALPRTSRPRAIGFKTDEIQHSVWVHQDGKTESWSAMPK